MRTLALALATTAALAFVAPGFAQNANQNPGMGSGAAATSGGNMSQSGNTGTQKNGAAKSSRSETTGQASGGQASGNRASGNGKSSINGRSETRLGARGHARNDVTIRNGRRHVVAFGEEPSSRTKISKKRHPRLGNVALVKRGHPRLASSEPSRHVVIHKRRPGVIVTRAPSSRTVVHERSSGPNVSVSGRETRTTTGSSTSTTHQQNGRSTTGSGSHAGGNQSGGTAKQPAGNQGMGGQSGQGMSGSGNRRRARIHGKSAGERPCGASHFFSFGVCRGFNPSCRGRT